MNVYKAVSLLLLICLLSTSNGWTQNKETVPVSSKPFNNSEQTFRFAIVSDRTGGMRGGVFKEAIGKLNILQPEFVLSVGDLIDGYTEDPEVWNAQWDEFDGMINNLEMPFYYVAGNHDTSNELLTNVWQARHGRDYYHFKYKDVLFLALNTDEIKNGGISKDQIQYFQKVLAENNDVSWTLIFMHRPLWSYGDTQGYSEVEKALGSRNYTVFSGHHHFYQFKMHNGMEHFTLATTGGGSDMRNPDVGEFDHITWVTMKEKGPVTAHLELSGIYEKDIVPEEDYADIQKLRQGNWLEIKPVITETELVSKFPLTLTLKNTSDREFLIQGVLADQEDMQFQPKSISELISPQSEKEIMIQVSSKKELFSIAELNNQPLSITLDAGFVRKTRNDIALPTSKKIKVDWKHRFTKAEKPITIDGDFSDWENTDWIDVELPQYFYEDWDWKGKDDGAFKFALTSDDKNIYVGVQFKDQKTIASPTDVKVLQDKFYVHLTSDGTDSSFIQLEIAKAGILVNKSVSGINYVIKEHQNGQSLELAFPISQLLADNSVLEKLRVNIGIMDHDRPENTKPSVLWWRPVWQSDSDYPNSGMFYFKK
tara:strand:- start:7735 stop:9519 length:1785 start_codon:yes stop_codon:yes gene_type:complete